MTAYHDNLANQIVKLLGGSSNIVRVSHCTTRLRFQLKQTPIENIKEIKSLPDVISVIHTGGLFQIVIGTHVEKLYQSILPLLKPQKHTSVSHWMGAIINTITGIFHPLLWLLSAGGILKGFVVLLSNLGWITIDSGTYRILFSAADTIFFFLPIFLGYTAAKYFNSNPLFSMTIAGALVHPEIITHVNWLFSQQITGQEVPSENFMGLPILYLNYSTSVIPILFATWFNVRLEQALPKNLSTFLYNWLTPFLCLILTIPITFLVIGPLSTLIANMISNGVLYLYHASPEIAGGVIGATWQILVVFGIHWCLVPIMMNNIAVDGYSLIIPLLIPAIFGQVGACLGVFFKTQNRNTRCYAGSAAITALFGVTEPAIYGITLSRKWPFIFACLSAAIGSSIIASFHVKSYSMGLLSLFSFIQVISPQGVDNTVIVCILAALLTLILSFILTYFFSPHSHDDAKIIEQNSPSISPLPSSYPKNYLQIASPLSGEVIPLSMVDDPTFSSEIMGKGIAIRPDNGTLFAPFDGYVTSIFNPHHAIGLKSEQGIELLIHIGLDTVKLQGDGFSLLVHTGEKITEGMPLIQFDLNKITQLGFDSTTPILITNSHDYFEVLSTNETYVNTGDRLLTTL
ncbi:beta-glucoside-specific PTS transporter subunit IIABC [Vibrio metschnikovii]|uniref:beta-glucoside-specific PTS transporter subunit IIABC n=1 Tax=Vibrio metschnikovii TaxID=28172 RepID=UPI002FC8E91D